MLIGVENRDLRLFIPWKIRREIGEMSKLIFQVQPTIRPLVYFWREKALRVLGFRTVEIKIPMLIPVRHHGFDKKWILTILPLQRTHSLPNCSTINHCVDKSLSY